MKTYNQINENYYEYSNYKIIEPMLGKKFARQAGQAGQAGQGAGQDLGLILSKKMDFDKKDFSAAENLFKNSNTSKLIDETLANTGANVDFKKLGDIDFNTTKIEMTAEAIKSIRTKYALEGKNFDLNDIDIKREINKQVKNNIKKLQIERPKLSSAKLKLKQFKSFELKDKIDKLEAINFTRLDKNKENLTTWINSAKKTTDDDIQIEIEPNKFISVNNFIKPDNDKVKKYTEKITDHLEKINGLEKQIKDVKKINTNNITDVARRKADEVKLYKDMSNEFDNLSSNILKEISFDEAKKIINKFDGADGKDDLLKKLGKSGKLNDDASNEIMNFVRKNNLSMNKLDTLDSVDSDIFKQVLFFQDYSKKINNNLKEIETDNIMDTIINEDTIKKLKDSGVFNQSDKIDINELSKKIPNFENLTPTDLMNIKKGEFPEDFPSDTQDIFKKIDSLGESDVVVNNLISKTRNKKISELGLNPSITDIRKKGKNIKDKISELNGEGFDILNNANELPMKFKNKNFADLDISELADLKSILKKVNYQIFKM